MNDLVYLDSRIIHLNRIVVCIFSCLILPMFGNWLISVYQCIYNMDSYDYLLFAVTRLYPIVLLVQFQISLPICLYIVIDENVKLCVKCCFSASNLLWLELQLYEVFWSTFIFLLIVIVIDNFGIYLNLLRFFILFWFHWLNFPSVHPGSTHNAPRDQSPGSRPPTGGSFVACMITLCRCSACIPACCNCFICNFGCDCYKASRRCRVGSMMAYIHVTFHGLGVLQRCVMSAVRWCICMCHFMGVFWIIILILVS